MKNSISKPVLVILLAGIALIVAVVWFGRQPAQPLPEATPVVAPAPPQPAAPPKTAPGRDKPATMLAKNGEWPAVIPISLTNFLTPDEAYKTSPIQTLPRGAKTYGGIEFWLQGLVQLQGTASRDQDGAHFPTHVMVPLDETNSVDGSIKERGKGIACLYLLAGTMYSSDEKFAAVVWHYADGSEERDRLYCKQHLRDWVRSRYEQPSELPNKLTKVAWKGPHPTRKEITLRLYRLALVNQHPDKVVKAVEFVSGMARPSLFVAALTLDPLPPGSRPDDLTSAEMPDPELRGQLQIYVQDTTGQALPAAEVSWNFRSDSGNGSGQKATTDLAGTALVRFPDTDLKDLEVSANHEGFSGRKMTWDTTSGDTIPASYILKLRPEVTIGGFVVDPEDNALQGATVSLYRFWTGEDMPNRKGEQAAFSTQKQTTDADGHWEAKGLPPDLLDHIGFDVKHPDFLSVNITAGNNGSVEKELRAGTYKVTLGRGLNVYGRVVDANTYPISGATVWAGRKYFRDRQQTQTDADGQFSFKNVEAGDTLFSASAKGRAPESRTVTVQSNMAAIVFQLKPGKVLNAHVQDEAGVAVANAHVGLEGRSDDPRFDAYEFSTSTDSQGNFSWDGAPDGLIPFYIYHDGFEAERGVKLTAGQANTVTLHRSRQLQGQVADAATHQPITKFDTRTGTASGDGNNVYGVIDYKSFTSPEGRFVRALTEAQDNALMVMADGYEDKVVRFPPAQGGIIQVLVEMTKSSTLEGVVLAPDGTPAPGVSVIAASPKSHSYVSLKGGRLHASDPRNKVATTDADGHFKVPSAESDALIVAAGPQGFGRAPLADVLASSTVRLLPWGRIAGTLKIGGQPAAGKEMLFTLNIPNFGTDFDGYKSTTDDQGQFTMENVPPGPGSIVRLIRTSPSSWSHSDSTPVEVKPGETTQVTLGDNGVVLVGRIRFDNPPTNREALNFSGNLSGEMPARPAFNSPAESRAYYQSPQYREMMRLHKNYSIEMRPDGAFTIDNVVPGNYSLTVRAQLKGERPWEHQLGGGSIPVTVPDSANPSVPIDIGEVALQPGKQY